MLIVFNKEETACWTQLGNGFHSNAKESIPEATSRAPDTIMATTARRGHVVTVSPCVFEVFRNFFWKSLKSCIVLKEKEFIRVTSSFKAFSLQN